MPKFEVEGVLSKKQVPTGGSSARGNWSKQEFLVEVNDGKFPTTLCMSAWGDDKIADLAKCEEGSKVKVSFDISSREYNGRWYTDLKAWRISVAAPQATQAPQGYAPPVPDMEPFPAPSALDVEDMPF